MTKANQKLCLFLDRDGVINIDYGYVSKKEDFIFIDGIFDLTRFAQSKNLLVIVVSNQSGIGRGIFTEDDFSILNEYMMQTFSHAGIDINAVYYCPTHPEEGIGIYKTESINRKPNPGMFISAAKEYNIDLKKSFMIGDRLSDIEASTKAGIGNRYLFNPKEENLYTEIDSDYIENIGTTKQYKNLGDIQKEIKTFLEKNNL